jgi:DNA-binding CsgD family transcriptional regulator
VFHRGWFQVIARDPRLSDAIRSTLMMYSTVRLAPPEASWPPLVEPQRFAGALVEHGPGFERWATALRGGAPTLPVLVFTPLVDPGFVGRLHARSIEVAMLPLYLPQLVAFVQRALASNFLPHDRVGRIVADLAERRGLTAREVQLVSYCLGNENRARVRRRLGISENTLKTQIRGLLRKCGERNVDALAKNLLRAALLVERTNHRAESIAPWLSPRLPGAA